MLSQRKFNRDFKLALCQRILDGEITKAHACREHALSGDMLDRWIAQFTVLGDRAFPGSSNYPDDMPLTRSELTRMKDLESLVGRLTLENEFLKAVIKKGDKLRGKKLK